MPRAAGRRALNESGRGFLTPFMKAAKDCKELRLLELGAQGFASQPVEMGLMKGLVPTQPGSG